MQLELNTFKKYMIIGKIRGKTYKNLHMQDWQNMVSLIIKKLYLAKNNMVKRGDMSVMGI